MTNREKLISLLDAIKGEMPGMWDHALILNPFIDLLDQIIDPEKLEEEYKCESS